MNGTMIALSGNFSLSEERPIRLEGWRKWGETILFVNSSSLEGEGLSGTGPGNFRAESKVPRAIGRSYTFLRTKEILDDVSKETGKKKKKKKRIGYDGGGEKEGGSVPPRLYNFWKFLFENSRPGALWSFVKFDADATRAPDGRECTSGEAGSGPRNFEASVDCRNERLARRKRRTRRRRKKRKVIRGTSLPTRATHRRIVCRSRACNYK